MWLADSLGFWCDIVILWWSSIASPALGGCATVEVGPVMCSRGCVVALWRSVFHVLFSVVMFLGG